MIKFVNAKLNLGLNILRKREDGYHELETFFYPVGIYNGTPCNPEPFCDILEININNGEKDEYNFSGNHIDCALDKNLVYKAVKLFREAEETHKSNKSLLRDKSVSLWLDKNIPDGAGLGGGSADASFTLQILNQLAGSPFSATDLVRIALKLGADCPFFIENKPVIATGIGEIMRPVNLNLDGWWAVIIKPDIYISTKDAFSGIKPQTPATKIEEIIRYPVDEWEARGLKNDFESNIFEIHPELREIKFRLKTNGAIYASMSGSGSSIFGLFKSKNSAAAAAESLLTNSKFICKL